MNRNNINLKKDYADDANNADENINRDVREVFLGMMPFDSVATKSDLDILKLQKSIHSTISTTIYLSSGNNLTKSRSPSANASTAARPNKMIAFIYRIIFNSYLIFKLLLYIRLFIYNLYLSNH